MGCVQAVVAERFVLNSVFRFLTFISIFALMAPSSAWSACGGTLRTWTSGGGNDNWSTTANWSGSDVPNTTSEDAKIIGGQRDAQMQTNVTIGCFEIASGLVTDSNNITVNIQGDYFRNHNVNSLVMTANGSWLRMSGSAAQTFENVDLVPRLEIANNSSVTFTHAFSISSELRFAAGWTGTLNINANLWLTGGTNITIPNGATVVIGNGAVVSSEVSWTVQSGGTLRILPGAQLRLGNGDTLTINTGGNMRFEGASGNPAVFGALEAADTPNFNMNGNLNADYFQIVGLGTAGLNINGVIQKLDNGDFQNPTVNGRHITLGASTSLPATFNNINFLNGENVANVDNFNATGYNGAGTVTVNNWGGSLGGAVNETDPNGKINWGTQAGTALILSDYTDPVNTINQNTTAILSTFAFSLNQSSTSTNITQFIISMIGTASVTDISSVRVYRDGAASRNCVYNAGAEVDLTGAVSLSGSPPTLTVNVTPGDISTDSDTNRYCIHIAATTSASARDAKTIRFSIENTADVTNSQGYSFSPSGSPPVQTSTVTEITGDAIRKWEGSSSTSWNTGGNWTSGNVPTSTVDCEVGVAQRVALLNTNPGSCQNVSMPSGGTMDWNNTANVLDVYADLDVQAGYTFSNATAGPGRFNLRGTAPQGLALRTEFPGNLTINNTGTGNNELVTVVANSVVGGSLTITNGTLRINAPYSLTVRGNLTCQTGAVLEIQAGATLKMGNNAVLDIDSGCTLKMIGTSNSNAIVTSDSGSSKYTVTIDGTVQAQYYTFSYLGTNGVTVGAGATIDSTYHFQNGTFTYPVNNNSTFLRIARQIPTNTLNNMTFSAGGSGATGTKNIDTTGAGAGTLTLDGYTGDLAGATYDTDPTYLLSWLGAVNTIDLTQEATGPTSIDAGSTYNMGRFGFQQKLAGASYSSTDLTSVKVTLTGTASGNDISSAYLYYDSNCDGIGGTLIGSGALSGNPASRTFTISGGAAPVEADVTSPPKRCLYVEYTVALAAVAGNTAGAQITASSDVANSQNYAISSSTQPPINLGTAPTIVGSSTTNWTGGTSTAWNTAGNWSAGVPNSTKNCQIDDAANDPVINGITATCKSLTIGNGTLTMTNGSGAVLELYGGFSNSGTFTQNDGTLRIRDDGATATNQSISSTSTLSSMTFNKTAGGEVFVNSTAMTINTLTIPAGSNFTFRIPNGKTLTLANSITYAAGTFSIEGGGTLKMGNATTFTVNSGGTLRMVGSSGSPATMTSNAGANSFSVVVNGTIQAQHYTFDHLALNGVTIASGASIDGTYKLQDGSYTCPKANNSTLLRLQRQVPGGTMNNMAFELLGCGVTGTKNIDTTGASAGTLTLDAYSGDLSGPTFDTDPTYTLSWTGAQNTIDITPTTASGGMNAGTTYNMGRFNFKQSLAGAGFSNANINSLRVTLTGTATASDISAVRIYYDSGCTGTGGTLLDSGTLAGSPASKTFSIGASAALVQSHATTPPTRCIYVEYDIAGGAINGRTAGAELSSAGHVTNDQGWSASPSTSFPVSLGAARTISGSTSTTWTGATNTTWGTAGNWSAGLPDSTKNCIINNVTNDPIVTTGTVACKMITVNTGGSVTINTGTILEIHDSISNSGTFTISGTGELRMAGTGAQTITSSSSLSKLSFSKTGGTVTVGSTNLQVDSLSFIASANFSLIVPDAKTLTLPNSVTFTQTSTLVIDPGGTVKMGNGTTLQFNSPSKLKMVGTVSKKATMNSTSGANSYNVVINTGTIEARYYTFDHLGVNGLTIESGASIDATNHLQDGQFIYPVSNNSTFLRLRRQVPTNTMDNCSFDLNGSGATGTKNIDTTSASAGTLTLNSYSGNLSGAAFDTDPSYVISWTGAINTIDLTQGATTPTTLNAGSTYNMGRFAFKQTQAGASFVNTDLTSLKLSLTGTATSSDIAAVKIYYDSDCNSTGGALIGSGTFSGSPLTRTFTIAASDATIPAHATTPPTVCIYVEFDIAAGATNANTAGVRIAASGDVVTSQSYTIAAGTPPPVTLGTPGTIAGATTTNWTGSVSTDWFVAGNWSSGVPDATKSCQITNLANDPNINGGSGTARCKNFVNIDGVVTLQNGTSAVLEVYGNYDNTGTLTQNNGTLRLVESVTATSQNFNSSSTVTALTFNKAVGGGDVRVTSTTTITTLTIPGGSNFDFKIPNGTTLTVTNGVTIPAATVTVESGGTLRIPNGQSLSVTGGTFRTTGVNDAWGPQSTSNKGKVTNAGSGTWSFSASSGSVNLVGFILEYLDTNGLNLSGSANLVALDGGQFVNLPNSVGARAIQINKTSGGTITETTPTNVGFMWGAANGTCTSPCTPSSASSYYLVYAPNCGGAMTLNFSEWFGSFTTGVGGGDVVDTEAKIYDTTEAGTCNVVISAASSPVSLSSFDATPFDASVSLDWRTGSELNHQGFNVYRSLSPSSGYIQVNPELIRNILTSTSFQGVYRYVDTSLINGLTYYYKIEDIAVNGARVMHGPVAATPMTGLGSPPPDSSSTNRGDSEDGADSGNGPDSGTIAQPGIIDLGNGVHIVARTRNSIRLEIIPPAGAWAPSSHVSGTETLSVPGYSRMTSPGKPELVERSILVEIEDQTSVSIAKATLTQGAASTHVVAPAPSWSLNAQNILVAAYSQDAATYASGNFFPSTSHYSVDPEIKTINGKRYIQISVVPYLVKPSSGEVKQLAKLVLDLSLAGATAWAPPSTDPVLIEAPAAVDGVLRIKYRSSGMYEVSFEELLAAGVEGPFDGVSVDALRAYYHGEEIPIRIVSADGVFGSGDKVYFHGYFVSSIEDDFDEVVLASFNVQGSSSAALRMPTIDANPTGFLESPETSTFAYQNYESDEMELFDLPVGDFVDRLYWTRILRQRGNYSGPHPEGSYFDIPLSLSGIDSSSREPVRLKLDVRGRAGLSSNATNHIVLYMNSIPFEVGDAVFSGSEPQTLYFEIPSNYFFSGTNTLRIQVMADRVPPGDYDIVDINKLEVGYRARRFFKDGVAEVYSKYPNSAISVVGLTAPVGLTVYDVSRRNQLVSVLSNVSVGSMDGGVTYQALFAGRKVSEETGRYYVAVVDGSYKKPSAFFLNYGASMSLKDPRQGADMIVIGSRALLDAAELLIDHRRRGGLRVAEVSLDQIYSEFGDGRASSHAIRDFIRHAISGWEAPAPQYLLILGDSSFDPKNKFGYGADPNAVPIPILKGDFIDFGTDHWFVADDENIPQLSVGRLPSSRPIDIENYAKKVIAYEAGTRSPTPAKAKAALFVSDLETFGEGFAAQNLSLEQSLTSSADHFTSAKIQRVQGQDAALKAQLISQFADAPLMMTYLGHGGPDRWASAGVFTVADAQNLQNERLPIISALNCQNSYFYDANPASVSIGEALIFNPRGGAIAFWGSTGMTVPPVQVNLQKNFINELGSEIGNGLKDLSVGSLLTRSKTSLGAHPSHLDTIRSWTLFGDPALKVPEGAFKPAAESGGSGSEHDPSEPPAPAPAGNNDSGGGGPFGCGHIKGVGGGGPGGFALEMMLLMALFQMLRSRNPRRSADSKELRGKAAISLEACLNYKNWASLWKPSALHLPYLCRVRRKSSNPQTG